MKTLKQSWLKGDLGKYRNFLIGPIEQIARPHFTLWTELEVRNCWRDFLKVLKEFIVENGKKNHVTNPLVIIAKNLFMLEHQQSNLFQKFIGKWQRKFELVKPMHVQHPTKINSTVNTPIYLEHILGSLYMLDAASKSNINNVMDMYSLISERQLYEIKLSLAHEEGIANHCRTISKKARCPELDLFILQIMSDRPNIKYKQILSQIEKSVGKEIKFAGYKPFILIREVHQGHIIWLDSRGNRHKAITSASAFSKRVSLAKRNLP